MLKKAVRDTNKQHMILAGYVTVLLALVLATWVLENPQNQIEQMRTLGKAAGTVSLTMLVAQFVLASRLRILERGIGLDWMMSLHRWNAQVLVLLVLLHPALAYYGPLRQLGLSIQQSFELLELGHYVGYLSLFLILITVVTSIYAYVLRLSYEVWRWIHKVAYVIILAGFVHSLLVSSNITAQTWIMWWWIMLIVITVIVTMYRYNVGFPKRWIKYKVTRVIEQTPDVRTVYMKPTGREPISYAPGQFAFVRFISKRIPDEEHHFTISSSPLEQELSFTIKELGDFTGRIDQLRQGDTAYIDGPYGTFSACGLDGPFVFIAGGIGVTPVRSMIRTFALKGMKQDITLVYANKTESDVVFKQEFDEYTKQFDTFNVLYIFSAEHVTGALYGHIDDSVLGDIVNTKPKAKYFVVGPRGMMDAVLASLLRLGVHSQQIYTEKFSLR